MTRHDLRLATVLAGTLLVVAQPVGQVPLYHSVDANRLVGLVTLRAGVTMCGLLLPGVQARMDQEISSTMSRQSEIPASVAEDMPVRVSQALQKERDYVCGSYAQVNIPAILDALVALH